MSLEIFNRPQSSLRLFEGFKLHQLRIYLMCWPFSSSMRYASWSLCMCTLNCLVVPSSFGYQSNVVKFFRYNRGYSSSVFAGHVDWVGFKIDSI